MLPVPPSSFPDAPSDAELRDLQREHLAAAQRVEEERAALNQLKRVSRTESPRRARGMLISAATHPAFIRNQSKLTQLRCTSLLPPLCLRQEIAVDHERLSREEKEDEERQRTQDQQRSAETALRPLGGVSRPQPQ